jgi:hypothetical protein
MPEDLDNEQRSRLWEHGMHAENNFFNQLSFFLIFESLLISGVLSANRLSGKLALIGVIVFGFLLTVFWAWTQSGRGYAFGKLKRRLEETLPEYQETLKKRKETNWWPMPNLLIMGVAIPTLVALLWVGLLVYILTSP